MIIHPNLLPAHEQDLWRATYAAAYVVGHRADRCGSLADSAVLEFRTLCQNRLEQSRG